MATAKAPAPDPATSPEAALTVALVIGVVDVRDTDVTTTAVEVVFEVGLTVVVALE